MLGGDGRRCGWCSTTRSARRWNGGLAVPGRPRRWRCAAGSCWERLLAARTATSPPSWAAIPRRRPSGEGGSLSGAWTASRTTRGRGRRARSPTPHPTSEQNAPRTAETAQSCPTGLLLSTTVILTISLVVAGIVLSQVDWGDRIGSRCLLRNHRF